MTVEKLENKRGGKKRHGGKRPGSGRKPAVGKEVLAEVKDRISSHALEEVRKKSRLLILLDKLFSEGRNGSIPAINAYLDRTLGKVVQPIGGPDGGPIQIRQVEVSFKRK